MQKSVLGNGGYNNSNNCPKVLFDTVFGGLSLATPVALGGSSKNWTTAFSPSLDTITGFDLDTDIKSLFGNLSTMGIVSIPESQWSDIGDFNTWISNTLSASTYKNGAQELSLSCLVREALGPSNPQSGLTITIPSANALANPFRTGCFEILFKLPGGLDTNNAGNDDSTGNFYTIFEIKKGGYFDTPTYKTSVGDWRLLIGVDGLTGTDKYEIRIDDQANGYPIIPGIGAPASPNTFYQKSIDAPIRTGVWQTLWLNLNLPASHADLDTGIVQAVITCPGYDNIVLCDLYQNGVTQLAGIADLPVTRIFVNNYTSAELPNPLTVGRFRLWDIAPCNLGYIDASNHGPLPYVPTPLSKGTMFGASNGNDANPGTEASPKTYQGAINAATAPGSVVFFRGGTVSITSAAHLSLWNVGTAEQPIIYEAYPGETVIIDGSGIQPGVGNQRRVNFSDSYQKLRGMVIQNFPEYGIYSGGDHNTVDGCEIKNCLLSGILNTGSYNTFINNYIHDCSDVGYNTGNYANGGNADGISISSGTGNYVGHNRVVGCSDDAIDTWQSLNTTVAYNICTGCGLGAGNGNGIKAGGNSTGASALVHNNLVYDNLNNGIDANTGINVTFRKNTSKGNGGVGYVLESDTIAIGNVSSGDGTVKSGTGVPTRNSWDISGTLTFESTTEGDADFLAVTQDGSFDGIGHPYV